MSYIQRKHNQSKRSDNENESVGNDYSCSRSTELAVSQSRKNSQSSLFSLVLLMILSRNTMKAIRLKQVGLRTQFQQNRPTKQQTFPTI